MDRQVELFCRISKLEDTRKNQAKSDLQNLFWSNFKSLKQATGLITKMAPSMSRCNIHYASYNAVEVRIRNKFGKPIPQSGLTTRMAEDRLNIDYENENNHPSQHRPHTTQMRKSSYTMPSNKEGQRGYFRTSIALDLKSSEEGCKIQPKPVRYYSPKPFKYSKAKTFCKELCWLCSI